MTVLFVTGTDTGVGKTVVSAVLARRAQAEGKTVVYVKPVQTGLSHGAVGSDRDFLAAAGIDAREVMRFEQPLAPAVAAEEAGVTIDFDELVASTGACGEDADLLVVEGAGGLLVPLCGDRTMADLALALEARLVVVVRPGLGTLNHTMLTVEAARARSLPIDRLVVCGFPRDPGVTERTNLTRLHCSGFPVEIVKFTDGVSVEAATLSHLARTGRDD